MKPRPPVEQKSPRPIRITLEGGVRLDASHPQNILAFRDPVMVRMPARKTFFQIPRVVAVEILQNGRARRPGSPQ
ncbi:MAG: hypothetical protein HY720_23760 [Planctomycetes bacterium]|nr:hypothetical protein [Planctomycetota bacterium]